MALIYLLNHTTWSSKQINLVCLVSYPIYVLQCPARIVLWYYPINPWFVEALFIALWTAAVFIKYMIKKSLKRPAIII
ncbi:MAG: hypothetical protein LBN07_00085 [Christensenellaceae bacterium]|nr:hypothetical protein [Christensenellaceae bacterium]